MNQMTTIVNTPPSEKSDSPMGWIIGLVILIVLGYLVYVYGLPALRNMQQGGVQINVPNKIDVNVNQTK